MIGISQSGQSPDVVSVIEDATGQGHITVAITNDADSPLAQAAWHVLPLHAGPERAVAATKTYTASLCAVAQVAAALTGDPSLRQELSSIPASVARQTFSGRRARLSARCRCAVRARPARDGGPSRGGQAPARRTPHPLRRA